MMNVRMPAIRFGLFTLALFGAFALWFGAGTATAVTGSQITAECHGWPSHSKVHWDGNYWKENDYGATVNSVHMTWNPNGASFSDYATLGGEEAHHTTPLFAHTLVAYVHFTHKVHYENGYVSGITVQVTCR